MKVTAEQIERANLVNLPDFLRNHGFDLKRVGKEYVLTPTAWFWYSSLSC